MFLANAEKPFGASIVIENVVYGSGMAASKKNAKAAAGVTSYLSPVTLAMFVKLDVSIFLFLQPSKLLLSSFQTSINYDKETLRRRTRSPSLRPTMSSL